MKTKKLLTFVILCVSLFAFAATGAWAGTYGDLTYKITEGEVTITDCDTSATEVEIPAEIEGYPVTSIDTYAFLGCTSLKKVYITDMASYLNCDFSYGGCPTHNGADLYLNGELVNDLVIPDGETTIGEYAFYGCSSLTSITIPDSVTSIGNEAFYKCTNLESVYITDLAAYLNCEYGDGSIPMRYASKLYLNGELVKDVVMPDGVIMIPDYAFNGCLSLQSVTIPSGVTEVGSYAFRNCSSLTSVAIPEGVTSIGGGAFCNCSSLTSITIPSSVTSIDYYAFEGCTNLESVYITDVAAYLNCEYDGWSSCPMYYASKLYINDELVKDLVIPDGVTQIPSYAFNGCLSLQSVTIPSGVTSIGDYAFRGCKRLSKVNIENGLQTIEEYAFSGCVNLTEIILPDSVTVLGSKYDVYSNCFSGCENLESITLSKNLTSIGWDTFYNCKNLKKVYISDLAAYMNCDFLYHGDSCPTCNGADLYLNGELVTNLVIPDGVTAVKRYAFEGCNSITSVTFPGSVKSIGDYSFKNCDSLTSITIPNTVTSIGKEAFYDCDNLESVSIAGSVKKIGNSAFKNCDKLSNLTLGEGIEEIGSYAFSSCYALKQVKLPSTIETIESNAFYYCSNLKGIWIDEDVYYIANDAFEYCDNLIIYGVADSYAETYANKNDIPFNAGPLPDGFYSISGSVKTGSVAKVTLLMGDKELSSDWICGGDSYTFSDLAPGTYTLRVSEDMHCTRDYTVTVEDGDVTQNVEIWLYGDVNGDGKVNTDDVMQINRKIAGLSSVFGTGDDSLQKYRFDVANVTAIVSNDTKLNTDDVMQINRRIAGLSSVIDRSV